MTATSDLVIERRRMRRRLAFWRVLAIVAVVATVIAIAARTTSVAAPEQHIARVAITGVIVDDLERDRELAKVVEDDNVKAVIVRINSPGGTVAGSEALYQSLRAVAEAKPVVAVMSEAAASGGYITALGADHIVARGATLTGSIGVIAEMPNIAELLENIGVDMIRVKSAPLKAEPSPLTVPPEGALEAQRVLIDDSYQWFRGLVGLRRGLEGADLDQVADGRVFSGRQALELGLIDAIGGEETALAWLEAEHEISADTTVRDRKWGKADLPFPFSILDNLGDVLTIPSLGTVPGPRLYAVIQ